MTRACSTPFAGRETVVMIYFSFFPCNSFLSIRRLFIRDLMYFDSRLPTMMQFGVTSVTRRGFWPHTREKSSVRFSTAIPIPFWSFSSKSISATLPLLIRGKPAPDCLNTTNGSEAVARLNPSRQMTIKRITLCIFWKDLRVIICIGATNIRKIKHNDKSREGCFSDTDNTRHSLYSMNIADLHDKYLRKLFSVPDFTRYRHREKSRPAHCPAGPTDSRPRSPHHRHPTAIVPSAADCRQQHTVAAMKPAATPRRRKEGRDRRRRKAYASRGIRSTRHLFRYRW